MNILWVSTSMFLSVIMGAVIFALLGVYMPNVLDWFLLGGDVVADWIYHLDLIGAQVRTVIRFLIDAAQMVFLFFVIVSRVLLYAISMPFQR